MAKARLVFLESSEEELIHQQSLRCLAEIGILVKSEKVLRMLEQYGAYVDFTTMIAKIPEAIVEKALASAPKKIRLCARDPNHDLEIPVDGIPFSATNGLSPFVLDLETGKTRKSTRADLASFTRLADALEPVDYQWTALTATDVPARTHGAHEIWVTLQNTSKHVQGVTVESALDARKQIELAALIAGGEKELKKRPLISIISCPIAPLTFEKGAIEAQAEFAKAGIPILSMSMSLAGQSSPVTLAGTIVNSNAENLASLVITQAASAGAPHIYTTESTPVDMKTATINYSAPELPLISAASGQMARRYELPCMVGNLGTSNSVPGLPSSFSEIAVGCLSTFAGNDLVAGMGSIDVAMACSMEQLVIDANFWEDFRVFMRRFTINRESCALDIMKEVGHGHSFIAHPHTVENFRKELHFWDKEKLGMQATLSTEMVPAARETARKLLREHEVAALDSDLIAQGDEILKFYEQESTSHGGRGRA